MQSADDHRRRENRDPFDLTFWEPLTIRDRIGREEVIACNESRRLG
jgi:hypothetical protein